MSSNFVNSSAEDRHNETQISDLEFIKRGLLLGEGFQLYLASANRIDDRRMFVRELTTTPGLTTEVIGGSDLRERPWLTAISDVFAKINDSEGRVAIVLSEIDEIVAEEPYLLGRLNEQRNELIAKVAGGIVILCSSYLLSQLRKSAPDTWSVRAADLDVSQPAFNPCDAWDSNHRLQPIDPPIPGEREELEKRLSSLPLGDKRGRAILRLAEICEHRGFSPSSCAKFYGEAAVQISEPWLSTLAQINAARHHIQANNLDSARYFLGKAIQSIDDLELDIQAHFHISQAELKFVEGDLSKALEYTDRAIGKAAQSSDQALLAEARLQRVRIDKARGNLTQSISDAKAAERESERIGNTDLTQRSRLILGQVAVSAGYLARAKAAWSRYLNELKSLEQESYNPLISTIADLERGSEQEAGQEAWKILRGLAEDKGSLPFLVSDAVHFALRESIWRKSSPSYLSTWIERLTPEIDETTKAETRGNLELIKAREALNCGNAERARSCLTKWNQHLKGRPAPMQSRIIRASCLLLEKREEDALRLVEGIIFQEPEFIRQIIQYLAQHARKRGKIADFPMPERLFATLLIRWLGKEAIRDFLDLLTGGEATEKLHNFVEVAANLPHNETVR